MTGPRLFTRNKPTQFYWKTANVIDDLGLSVYAFRLYAHLARMASRKDADVSTRALATACKMSAHAVSDAKQELAKAGLVGLQSVKGERGRPYHVITILDIQARNVEHCQSSLQELISSPDELISSPQEFISSRGATPLQELGRTGEEGSETATPPGVNSLHAETVATPTRTPNVATRRISKPVDVPAEIRNQTAPETDMGALRKTKAVQVYRETFGFVPRYKAGLASIVERVDDIARWSRVCDEWANKGYRAENIADLLNVYEHGWRTNGTGTANVANPSNSPAPGVPAGAELRPTPQGYMAVRVNDQIVGELVEGEVVPWTH